MMIGMMVWWVLIIVGIVYGIYQAAEAGYGWFQMSGAVDEMASRELPGIIDRVHKSGAFTAFDNADREPHPDYPEHDGPKPGDPGCLPGSMRSSNGER